MPSGCQLNPHLRSDTNATNCFRHIPTIEPSTPVIHLVDRVSYERYKGVSHSYQKMLLCQDTTTHIHAHTAFKVFSSTCPSFGDHPISERRNEVLGGRIGTRSWYKMQNHFGAVPTIRYNALEAQGYAQDSNFFIPSSPCNSSSLPYRSHRITFSILSPNSDTMVNSTRDGGYKAYLLPLVISMPIFITYLITWLFSWVFYRLYRRDSKPPLAPYRVPVLGHALSFFWDTGFVGKIQR